MNAKAEAIVRMGKIPTATDAGLGPKFADLVKQRQLLIRERDDAIAALGDSDNPGINAAIEQYLVDADIKVVTCGDNTVTRCNGTNVSLKKEILLQNLLDYGVDAEDAAALVDESSTIKKYTYVQITATKKLAERADQEGFVVESGPIKSKKGGKKK